MVPGAMFAYVVLNLFALYSSICVLISGTVSFSVIAQRNTFAAMAIVHRREVRRQRVDTRERVCTRPRERRRFTEREVFGGIGHDLWVIAAAQDRE